MNKKYRQYLLFSLLGLFVTVLMVSCGNRRHEKPVEKLKKKNDKELIRELFAKDDVPFDFFTARISVDLKRNTQEISFSCYIKLKVDSAFSGSIKKGPVVAYTFKGTQDSIWVVDKFAKCYIAENLNYVSSLFGTTVEFDFFQDLILGLPVGLNEDIKYQQIDSKDHYIIGTHKKRDFKKLENDRLNPKKDSLMLIQYHMDPVNMDLMKITVDIPSDTTSIRVDYLERKMVGDFKVPEETEINITNPKDTINIRLNYGTVKINEPKSLNIKIPDSYVECP